MPFKIQKSKTARFLNAFYDKVITNETAAQAAMAVTLMCPLMAGASATGNTADIMSTALGVVFTIFQFVGVFYLVMSVVNLFNSIKQEDGDRQQKAIVGLVISAVMIGLKYLVSPLIQKANVGITI